MYQPKLNMKHINRKRRSYSAAKAAQAYSHFGSALLIGIILVVMLAIGFSGTARPYPMPQHVKMHQCPAERLLAAPKLIEGK